MLSLNQPLHVPTIKTTVRCTLNIGLGSAVAYGKYKSVNFEHGPHLTLTDILETPYKAAHIIDKIVNMGTTVEPETLRYKVCQSDTEATLVVEFTAIAREIIGQVFYLSDILAQDCIAVWLHNDVNGGIGQLIGRYNYVWRKFDTKYFIFMEQNHD